MYSSGLKLGSAAIFNQNLFFEMASRIKSLEKALTILASGVLE